MDVKSKKEERRETMPPVPENLDELLTVAQRKALLLLEQVGWHVAFVRRKHIPTIVVVTSPEKDRYGVLLDNGEVDFPIDLKLRPDDVKARGAA